MIKIGEYQTLSVIRARAQGFYLGDDDGEEVLLPLSHVPDDLGIDDKIEVFVYTDSEDVPIATTDKPLLTVGEFASLKVKDVNKFGAFCDWGLPKDLLIPFRNQEHRLKVGQNCIVYLYLDMLSDRLVGTCKLDAFLEKEAVQDLSMGQEVDVLVRGKTDLGYNVIVDQKYPGLVYKNEVHKPLRVGMSLKGYVKPIREDKKIDISLTPIGHQSIEPNAQKILEKLKENDGFLPFTDKSDPDLLRDEFGISKKLFKKAIGNLYRQKLVELKEEGIYQVN